MIYVWNRYSIRVGRSSSPQGPFVDKSGKDLVDGGGEIVYGSNGDVYAPGGQGVLSDEVEGDVLYYHYCAFLSPFFLFAYWLESDGANGGCCDSE